MKKSLYHIQQEYQLVLSELDELDGEVTPELEQRLMIAEHELQEKGANYALVIHDYTSRIDAIDTQIERLENLKSSYKSKSEVLKSNIKNAMLHFGLDKIEHDLVKLSFRKSESVEVENQDLIPKEFIKEKISYSPDKTAIKEAIKGGQDVQGCKLVTNYNLQVK